MATTYSACCSLAFTYFCWHADASSPKSSLKREAESLYLDLTSSLIFPGCSLKHCILNNGGKEMDLGWGSFAWGHQRWILFKNLSKKTVLDITLQSKTVWFWCVTHKQQTHFCGWDKVSRGSVMYRSMQLSYREHHGLWKAVRRLEMRFQS